MEELPVLRILIVMSYMKLRNGQMGMNYYPLPIQKRTDGSTTFDVHLA